MTNSEFASLYNLVYGKDATFKMMLATIPNDLTVEDADAYDTQLLKARRLTDIIE